MLKLFEIFYRLKGLDKDGGYNKGWNDALTAYRNLGIHALQHFKDKPEVLPEQIFRGIHKKLYRKDLD
jgi:hypothetical protein